MRTYPKLRRTYTKLRRQLPVGAHKFKVGAHKFMVAYLILDNFFKQIYGFLLTPTSKSYKTNCILIAASRPFDLYIHARASARG